MNYDLRCYRKFVNKITIRNVNNVSSLTVSYRISSMGGSSGGPTSSGKLGFGSGGGGGSSSDTGDCTIQFKARIHGPVPGLADNLNVGEMLNVVQIEGPPVQLGLYNRFEERVGSLAGQRELIRILDCIEAGESYVAEVQSSSGPMIYVQVRNA